MGEPANKISYGCSAMVTITLRVEGEGTWGATATVAEVQRQGGKETLTAIERAFRDAGIRYHVVGTPLIGAITWEPKP